MMKSLLVSIFILVSAFSAQAQQSVDPERLQLARAYIQSTKSSINMRDIIIKRMEPVFVQIMKNQPDLFAEKETKLRQVAEVVLLSAIDEATSGLDETMARLFTADEIRALQIFSASPIGQSVLKKLPVYSAAVQPMTQQTITSAIPDLLIAFRDEGIDLDN